MLCHLPKEFYVIGIFQHVHQTSQKTASIISTGKNIEFCFRESSTWWIPEKGVFKENRPELGCWTTHQKKKQTLLNLLNLGGSNLPEKNIGVKEVKQKFNWNQQMLELLALFKWHSLFFVSFHEKKCPFPICANFQSSLGFPFCLIPPKDKKEGFATYTWIVCKEGHCWWGSAHNYNILCSKFLVVGPPLWKLFDKIDSSSRGFWKCWMKL